MANKQNKSTYSAPSYTAGKKDSALGKKALIGLVIFAVLALLWILVFAPMSPVNKKRMNPAVETTADSADKAEKQAAKMVANIDEGVFFFYDQINRNEYKNYNTLLESYQLFREGYNLKRTTALTYDAMKYWVEADHPEIFWVGPAEVKSNGISTSVTSATYLYDEATAKAMTTEIQLAAVDFLKGVEDFDDEYAVAKQAYEYLAKNLSYSSKGENSGNVYGALIDHKCNSYGYAKAYEYLMQCAGIQCVMQTGKVKTGGEWVDRAWNVVRIGDQLYNVDVAMGDKGDGCDFGYLCRSDEALASTHKAAENHFVIECTDDSLK